LSNLIKSDRVVALEDLKRLELIRRTVTGLPQNPGAQGSAEGVQEPDDETRSLRDRILQDAEQTAQEILRQAREEAAQIRQDAEREIEEWWNARRAEDETIVQSARDAGYEEGYKAGAMQAESDLRSEWEERLKEAEKLLDLAYETKEKVIAEAEVFVVELSCAIAEKLIGAQLEKQPELAIRMFAQALARRQEQGVITLCVAPSQFEFVQAAKHELALSLDSQAELKIMPDASVGEGGCVIRSSYGSIDARIDTQLSAIRAELLRAAAQIAEEGDGHAAS
jgi:flagellar assembly protein FliH